MAYANADVLPGVHGLHDDSDASFTIRIHRELLRQGYLVGRRPGVNILRLAPSLTIDLEDIDGFLETFEGVLTDAKTG